MSGFESDDTTIIPDSQEGIADSQTGGTAAVGAHLQQPRSTLSSGFDLDHVGLDQGSLTKAGASSHARSLNEPHTAAPSLRSSMRAWGLGKRRGKPPPAATAENATLQDAHTQDLLPGNDSAARNATEADEMAMAAASGGAYTTLNSSSPMVDRAAQSFWQATFAQTRSAIGVITASTAASAAASASRVAALHAIGRRGSEQPDGLEDDPLQNASDPAQNATGGSTSGPGGLEDSTAASVGEGGNEVALETENLQDTPANRPQGRESSGGQAAVDVAPLGNGAHPVASGKLARSHPSPQERWAWGQYLAAFSHLSSPSPEDPSDHQVPAAAEKLD